MRRIASAAAVVGVAASLLTAVPASAVCMAAWQAVTGRCSPCEDANAAFSAVEDKTGVPMPMLVCVD